MLFGRDLPVQGRIQRVLLYTAVAALPLVVWYLVAQAGVVDWPRASSWFGTLLGYVGGLIIFFEMLLWLRKRSRGRKWKWLFPQWSTKRWLYFHIICGWTVFPVIVIHSGFAFGGWLSAITMLLFLAVIASGVYGLVLQQWLPKRLLEEIPDETIAIQTDDAIIRHVEETRLLIDRLTPHPGADESPQWAGPVVSQTPAVRLREFAEMTLSPYLLEGRFVKTPEGRRRSPLASRAQASVFFNRLRTELPIAAHGELGRLEQFADLRRQWDTQRQLNWWLHSWLVVHAPLSLMMVIFMVFHAVKALKFW